MADYVLSVSASAIICALAVRLTENQGSQGTVIKLIAGLLLTFSVIRPVADLKFTQWDEWNLDMSQYVQAAVGEGEDMTRQALADGIISRTQAYILDKAESLGLSLEVKVTVSEDTLPVPKSVWLRGSASPYAKARLTSFIQEDLGIAREDQTWN